LFGSSNFKRRARGDVLVITYFAISRSLILFSIVACGTIEAQTSSSESDLAKPGIKEVQIPFASLKPSAMIKVGGTADWVLITDDAVWVASTKPHAVLRIDPATNKIVARVKVHGEACSGLASGFGSIWAPICGRKPVLGRIDAVKNTLAATLPIGPAGPEGGLQPVKIASG
jgi:virginiamycin B lyase